MPAPLHPRGAAVDLRHDTGPFDIIGDVHGCAGEVEDLLRALGYQQAASGSWSSPSGRTPVFLGDLVDRGPRNVDALRLVMRLVADGVALCVPGNHDLQMVAHLRDPRVPVRYGLDVTLAELVRETAAFRDEVCVFFDSLKGHYLFDGGRLVVAHTGLPESLHGVDTPEVRELAAYGLVGDDAHPSDVNLRHPWLPTYTGAATVVYGHTRVLTPAWYRNTLDIDTGCVYGWRLTALQWPERRLVSVGARAVHFQATKPFLPEATAPRG